MKSSPAVSNKRSDPQRDKVYQLEDALFGTVNNALLSRAAIGQAVEQYAAVFDVPPPTVQYRRMVHHDGEQRGRYITLSTHRSKLGRSPITLCHEFAHYLCTLCDPDDTWQPHGPEFVGIYALVLETAGVTPRTWIFQHAKEFKVKFKRFRRLPLR